MRFAPSFLPQGCRTWLQAGGFHLQEGQLALDHAEEMIILYGAALQLTA